MIRVPVSLLFDGGWRVKIIANGPEYSSERVIAVRRTVRGGRKSVREEEEEGEEVARGLQRRETLICISNRPP